jgi:sugar/nucleoside kinase (ribokinase family)
MTLREDQPAVVVVGNAGVDTNVYLDREDLDPGTEGHFTRNLDYAGQAGGFASRGYARLGHRTAFVGALGEDAAGGMVRAALAGDGVDLRGIFTDPAGTARSVNLVFWDGRRRFFYDGKGHMALRPDLEVCRSLLAGARLVHVNIPNWARRVLPIARGLGVPVACDVQDVVDPADPYRRDFVLGADYLFISAANHPDPAPLLRAYWRLNPGLTMVVGMGSRGCALGTAGEVRFVPPPPLDLPVVDTNGAGDALAVGFLTGRVLGGRSLEESVLRGQLAARHACAQAAPKGNLVTAAQLDAYAALVPG